MFVDVEDYSFIENEEYPHEDEDFGERIGRRRYLSKSSGQSSKSFKCPSEGFHPDPDDCTVFYRCVPSGDGFTTFWVRIFLRK